MSQDRFDSLLQRVADMLGPQRVPHLLQRGLLAIAGADVLLTHAPELQVRVLVDLGPMPAHADAGFLRSMLELNLACAADGWPALGLHPDNGHVIAFFDAVLDELETQAAMVRLLFVQIPSWIDAWRDEQQRFARSRARVSLPSPTMPAATLV